MLFASFSYLNGFSSLDGKCYTNYNIRKLDIELLTLNHIYRFHVQLMHAKCKQNFLQFCINLLFKQSVIGFLRSYDPCSKRLSA